MLIGVHLFTPMRGLWVWVPATAWAAWFDPAVLHWLLRLGDSVVATGQCRCGSVSVAREAPAQAVDNVVPVNEDSGGLHMIFLKGEFYWYTAKSWINLLLVPLRYLVFLPINTFFYLPYFLAWYSIHLSGCGLDFFCGVIFICIASFDWRPQHCNSWPSQPYFPLIFCRRIDLIVLCTARAARGEIDVHVVIYILLLPMQLYGYSYNMATIS